MAREFFHWPGSSVAGHYFRDGALLVLLQRSQCHRHSVVLSPEHAHPQKWRTRAHVLVLESYRVIICGVAD